MAFQSPRLGSQDRLEHRWIMHPRRMGIIICIIVYARRHRIATLIEVVADERYPPRLLMLRKAI